jgi:hypothetical protein
MNSSQTGGQGPTRKDYPSNIAVIVPAFHVLEGVANSEPSNRSVYLTAFSIFKAQRIGQRFQFDEIRITQDIGADGVDMLSALTGAIDRDTVIAGKDLDQLFTLLFEVPSSDHREAKCKQALKPLTRALGNEVQDADWYLSPMIESLDELTDRYCLSAKWSVREREVNPHVLEQRLSARAQAIWLAIAKALLSPEEMRQATECYDLWRTAHAIT